MTVILNVDQDPEENLRTLVVKKLWIPGQTRDDNRIDAVKLDTRHPELDSGSRRF